MPFLRRRKAGSDTEQPEDATQTPEGKSKGGWKRPANTAFKQQRLKAWQPILTPKVVLPTFFILGLLFAPIGGLLVWGSNLVSQITIDYTDCDLQTIQTDSNDLHFTDVKHFSYNLASKDAAKAVPPPTPQWAFVQNSTTGNNKTTAQTCYLQFELPADMKHSVFLYYKLTNFYQNHRRYVKSLDTDQLRGDNVSFSSLSKGDCAPLATIGNRSMIYPCGLIANSLFNDTIVSTILLNPAGGQNQTYNFTEDGIAWPGEKKKYTDRPKTPIDQLVPPPGWQDRFPGGYTEDNFPNLQEDLHFQNWMRTAALPTFTKLYARNDEETMTKGTYQIMIWTNFPVRPYGGTKSIVISTVSWIGGKNPFLGWAYVGASGLLVLLGIAGTIRHLIKRRRLGDMNMLSWNQPGAR